MSNFLDEIADTLDEQWKTGTISDSNRGDDEAGFKGFNQLQKQELKQMLKDDGFRNKIQILTDALTKFEIEYSRTDGKRDSQEYYDMKSRLWERLMEDFNRSEDDKGEERI